MHYANAGVFITDETMGSDGQLFQTFVFLFMNLESQLWWELGTSVPDEEAVDAKEQTPGNKKQRAMHASSPFPSNPPLFYILSGD